MAISKKIENVSSINWGYVKATSGTIKINKGRNEIKCLYALPAGTFQMIDITPLLSAHRLAFYIPSQGGRNTKGKSGYTQAEFHVAYSAETENSLTLKQYEGSSAYSGTVYYVYGY